MDGLFVITPQCPEELRSTRDNYTISAFVPATWQLLDYITEEYNINMNRIFATGQSMGGMQVIAMASQRDNYFAGIWENGCQWGANWNKEEPYPERGGKLGYYTMSTDPTIWTKDDDGNDSEYGQNWYYLISDDNLMISNCRSSTRSRRPWMHRMQRSTAWLQLQNPVRQRTLALHGTHIMAEAICLHGYTATSSTRLTDGW